VTEGPLRYVEVLRDTDARLAPVGEELNRAGWGSSRWDARATLAVPAADVRK